MTFPRHRNGHVDTGKPLLGRRHGDAKCPNCNSDKYRETVSLEECTACGYRVDYWGGGANEVARALEDHVMNEERTKELDRDLQLEAAAWDS